ncbi:MAG TPA: neuraminidase-like domain-containing protein [Bryobacteraceae bacterium]|jgi:hypothetical protein|nr:neuraminidase-like domain-containing protein [Bryobacteraceae bacterium]
MQQPQVDVGARVSVVDAQGKPFAGAVDLAFQPRAVTGGQPVTLKGADASKEIDVTGLGRAAGGNYELTVTPADSTVKPVSQQVSIPASGIAQVTVVVGGPASTIIILPLSVHGSLVLDNGLAAAGVTVRAYNIGFGGQATKLGEAASDTAGAYTIAYRVAGTVNLQMRVVDATGKEVTISAIKYGAAASETLNLVVPVTVKPPAAEFDRLTSALTSAIGQKANLGAAQESGSQKDLTLLSQTTNWDARLIAFAATASQQATSSGVTANALYALYRTALPTDPSLLATVPGTTITAALTKASTAGIVQMTDAQIKDATVAVQNFSTKTLLTLKAPGAVSTFSDLLTPVFKGNATQQTAFANLYFSQTATNGDFWAQAAQLNLPSVTVDALRLQGKFLFLTFNNAPLAAALQQQIPSAANLSQLADKDFHKPATWQNLLTQLAGAGGDTALSALIPPVYPGSATADRAAAYAGDLARQVRLSYPTQVAARMIETGDLAIPAATAPQATAFLRAAATLGYSLGRTPLNRFLTDSAGKAPALDSTTKNSVATLHRLYQITPSTESLQAALKLGLTSANQIAKIPQDEFTAKYAYAFPPGEAALIYGQARTVSSVTFTAFASAKAMETSPPVYGLSASSDDLQVAKNTLVQQFPTMASLFGNIDFCQCEDCRSVLSPAAYFVDVLDLLGTNSAPNAAGYVPLDVLIGKDATVPGRRPDLGALPLTCENTNTALPYIDLVNEIFEYYIAHSQLDAGVAYDTGTAASADLIAEPQHIIPQVYTTTLQQARYPLNLPFDLWIETVRGFLGYFKITLSGVLEKFRGADTLELFSGTPVTPYYRAQILTESLGISPAEYAVYTNTDKANWFQLYGAYANEAAALADLKSAKSLAAKLGVTYQDVVDLVETGFLNPGLYPLIFQFERFGLDMSDAFSYTNQPGYPAFTAQETTTFEAQLDGITAQYVKLNPTSTFNARTWLTTLLPANYSKKVLVLADPDSGCDFAITTLQYADGSPVAVLDLLKFNLFVRLRQKLGWTLDELDRALQAFFPSDVPAFTDSGFNAAFGQAWKTALVYLAHLDDLNTRLQPALGRPALLPLWSNLPTQGDNSLYSQLFLNAGVLNSDFAFDDPNGNFPWPSADLNASLRPLSAHAAMVQGSLGLSASDINAILADAGVAALAQFTLANLSICYRYSLLAQCLDVTVSDLIALTTLSGLNPFQPVSGTSITTLAQDVLWNQTAAFVKQASVVGNSGFDVEDLQYLLRQIFDPVGKYATDPNALLTLLQAAGTGLQQIAAQEAVPANLTSLAESLIDQTLSGLIPATILKTLFGHLTNSTTYTASQGGVAAAIDPAPFAQEPELGFQYVALTQTQSVSYEGLLPDWKKAQLETIDTTPLFAGLLDGLQKQAWTALAQSIGDLLGVWASLAQYEAVATGVAAGSAIGDPAGQLAAADAALSFSYDQSDQLEWLGYRGVLTDQKRTALTGFNNSATLATLLAQVQQQSLPAYNEMTGSLLAMWANGQTYSASQTGVAPANQIDPVAFAAAVVQAQQNGAIVNPVPVLAFQYNPASQTESVTCQGVLTDAMRAQLSGLIASPVLATLLTSLHTQAEQLYQSLAANLLTVGPNDLDNNAQPYLAAGAADQQRLAKAELVKVFLPLQTQKLSRDFVVETLSQNLDSDPVLTEALVTDAALLTDPTSPGESLLKAFLKIGQQGVSATYYTSVDETGAASASGVAATADTSDPTNSAGGTQSCHFEGYLQAPVDGPYRFFAELGNLNAKVTLRVDPPDASVLPPNPVIQQTAVKDGDEASQFLQLKGGVAYHFTLDFQQLGAAGARLLVQGENLPKGPLSQLQLYSESAVDAFLRGRTLLAKTLQILQVTDLDVREISWLVANSAQFNNLRLSSLPTQPSDDSVPRAVALFSQFLALADYADLRKGPAGGTDGLIDVFEATSQAAPPTPPATVLANLTRRDPQVVQDVAAALGPDPHFSNNTGIRRMWDALQLVQVLGLPVTTIAAATGIINPAPAGPDQIAANFRNAVRAQYTATEWRPIAQSVFDPLRQRKRDALVSYLLNTLGLQNSNQLFEYFLVDPGMEPVVQTSRLRLAMSSLQTFVQRCLLNLENGNTTAPAKNVAPNAIRADWWEWMKRYRVWEANREIFLFPENWMDPELRLDKTDLFQALEGDLLQGDVTSDLVEDSFLTYLKGLDLRARLDIVATYLEQDAVNPGLSTLHVLGRTYGHPHKYFYRTYVNSVWSGWLPVSLDIEGDHIALAVWRGRLNVFWLSFVVQAQGPGASGASNNGTPVSGLAFSDLSSDIFTGTPQKLVQVQLHWSEYVQGKWTNRISTDVSKSPTIAVHQDFDISTVHLHVTNEIDSQGNEGAILIHVDFPAVYETEYWDTWVGWLIVLLLDAAFNPSKVPADEAALAAIPRANHTFRVTSKNCDPDFSSAYWQAPQAYPYDTPGVDATFYTGSTNLTDAFQSEIQTNGTSTTETENVLNTVNNFDVLTPSNTVVPPFLSSSEPLYAAAGALVAPVFFRDTSNPGAAGNAAFRDERTFYVQPSLTETVVEEWDGWAIFTSPAQVALNPGALQQINVVAQVPAAPVPVNPGDPVYSLFQLQNATDWVTAPSTVISYASVPIGKTGGIATAPAVAAGAKLSIKLPSGAPAQIVASLKPVLGIA